MVISTQASCEEVEDSHTVGYFRASDFQFFHLGGKILTASNALHFQVANLVSCSE